MVCDKLRETTEIEKKLQKKFEEVKKVSEMSIGSCTSYVRDEGDNQKTILEKIGIKNETHSKAFLALYEVIEYPPFEKLFSSKQGYYRFYGTD